MELILLQRAIFELLKRSCIQIIPLNIGLNLGVHINHHFSIQKLSYLIPHILGLPKRNITIDNILDLIDAIVLKVGVDNIWIIEWVDVWRPLVDLLGQLNPLLIWLNSLNLNLAWRFFRGLKLRLWLKKQTET